MTSDTQDVVEYPEAACSLPVQSAQKTIGSERIIMQAASYGTGAWWCCLPCQDIGSGPSKLVGHTLKEL